METPTTQPAAPNLTPWEISPETYDEELRGLVVALAPRFFVIVQEYEVEPGVNDAAVAAWGMAFEDGPVRVVGADGTGSLTLASPDRAVCWYSRPKGDGTVSAKLLWLPAPDPADLQQPAPEPAAA
ncbi:hypothetical protein RKE29_04125 [Streptomyces sp. B1866]|uniref:hypothetical protein n=1 Tax=Streptomyces sp. B1866 TaxID=3075431 RepID=UPI002890FB35|nr:hypothetical protein [Streptomyces sp. B1866]MDT3395838.1 hypothetical protein [Streptomyces sp. B1866]